MQVEMSLDIARQIDARAGAPDRAANGQFVQKPPTWGVTEAPCGTGKGLAYSVPGVLAALRARAVFDKAVAAVEKRREEMRELGADEASLPKPPQEPEKFICSTANIALQEQLVRKDIPALAEMLGVRLDIRLLKSRQNYLCRYKIRTLGGTFDRRVDQVLDWMRQDDCDGDKESLPFDGSEVWQDVSATSEECLGQGCAHFSTSGDGKLCYWRAAMDGYTKAHVIVTNHHYLMMARPMRSVLLAVDEMHELENSLRGTQSKQLSEGAGRGLAKRISSWFKPEVTQPKLEAPVRWLSLKVGEYWKANAHEYKGKKQDSSVVLPDGWLGSDQGTANDYADGLVDLIDDLERVCTGLGCVRDADVMNPPRYSKGDAERAEEGARAAKAWMQLCSLHERFTAVADGLPYETWAGGDGPWAIFADRFKKKDGESERFVVTMVPADVAWATTALARAYPVTVLTSATVPHFPALRLSLGLLGEEDSAPIPEYEKRLPSPYPLAKMGVLIIPPGPSPKDGDPWVEHAVCTIIDLVKLVGGGVLVLSTSIANMWKYGNGLRDKSYGAPEFPVKVQGEAGRGELREWFKTNQDNGVLVATSSFFQGLDVQGDNCRCVVIDKAPFGRPDDPIENAVGELLVERAGKGSAFDLRSVPQAATKLAQGGGRLIRSQTDRGAIVLLDPRILGTGESWKILKAALPPFPVSRDLEDARRVLVGEPLVGLVAPPAPLRGRTLASRPTREAS